MEFKVLQIAQLIDGEVEGDQEAVIKNVGKIEDAQEGDISFLANPKYENYIYNTNATAVIVRKDFIPTKSISTILIKVDDPYTGFSSLLEQYEKMMVSHKSGVESPSFLGENSSHGEGIYRGAFSYIGKNVEIGKDVKIYPNVYIGDNTVIGDHTILYAGVKVYANSKIGSHCVLQAGAVIGSDGFGFAPQPDGSYKRIPQLGNVILDDFVDVGANTTVDCATMGSTVIHKGAKIDNLVQVAHNVEIGKNTVIASQTGISGSTKIGNECVIGGQVGIVGHIEIGNGVQIGAQSGVGRSMKDNAKIIGSPAMDKTKYGRIIAVFRNLPELRSRVYQLEKKS
ncbi:UDP-3-O-(3-hydroxymyristoyl)glucosamine N-acyltransferase [Xanthovirga aplysinae]|uniref:UDP-3-O-(3-hydroxymyristoyl)glucosamine N-acyltransferase n=1 Tax=Xanthovirga aplysinae TaxID=2529853 RepID=UPI0012BD239F|nr:UDP-3-O-(3-hydroxymyristoyl)glucosamine N-acyltransferase [Xanthovirga aplysinae]MTI30639.1 UDP-3-O-(3-hydroxymyristoyl)glucosamine N-acyltransferase [Xanthovirga aplysinae]